ncbi:ARA1 [Linum perenne]
MFYEVLDVPCTLIRDIFVWPSPELLRHQCLAISQDAPACCSWWLLINHYFSMPTREACHMAVQRNDPNKHNIWKHAQARQNAKGLGPTHVLQIVSYGSELSNRGPTFDMDLSDFIEDGHPMPYEKAMKYFAQDPSKKWAAYVAGMILVLMKELGVRFEDSINMLVYVRSSNVDMLPYECSKALQCLLIIYNCSNTLVYPE